MEKTKITLMAAGALVSFLLTALLGKMIIPKLRAMKIGQTIREIGPKWHQKKDGTPTMGGLIFILGIILSFIIIVGICLLKWPAFLFSVNSGGEYSIDAMQTTKIFAGIIMAVACGVLGFMDDYIKVVKKQNMGLTSSQKMGGLLIISFLYSFTIYIIGGTAIQIPFYGLVDFGVFFIPFCMFVVIAMTNAVNLTDGVDGLCGSVTFVISLFFVAACTVTGFFGFSILASVLAGGLAGFLAWNLHPAKVFMGDTGSLFLGGILTALAIGIDQPLLLVPMGIVYIIEALSVMMQVAYYKSTKDKTTGVGKRLFKMTPIHHHFEISGWSENKIVIVFSIITLAGCVGAYLLMKS